MAKINYIVDFLMAILFIVTTMTGLIFFIFGINEKNLFKKK